SSCFNKQEPLPAHLRPPLVARASDKRLRCIAQQILPKDIAVSVSAGSAQHEFAIRCPRGGDISSFVKCQTFGWRGGAMLGIKISHVDVILRLVSQKDQPLAIGRDIGPLKS